MYSISGYILYIYILEAIICTVLFLSFIISFYTTITIILLDIVYVLIIMYYFSDFELFLY